MKHLRVWRRMIFPCAYFLLCVFVMLATIFLTGCAAEKHEWKCIGGTTHELVNGAWVQIDGHLYANFKDGPIQCSDEAKAAPDPLWDFYQRKNAELNEKYGTSIPSTTLYDDHDIRRNAIWVNESLSKAFEACGTPSPILINVGAKENDGTGDSIAHALSKVSSDLNLLVSEGCIKIHFGVLTPPQMSTRVIP